MPTGTKIIIAVIVALFGSVVIYFAFVAPPASPTGGQGSAATGLGPKPSTPSVQTPLSKPTPTTPPNSPPSTPPSASPDRGTISAGIPTGGARPAPAVSDPMNSVGRDPTRPAVDPTTASQSGGKGEANPTGNLTGNPTGNSTGNPTAPPTTPSPSGNSNPAGTPSGTSANPPNGGNGVNPAPHGGTAPGSTPPNVPGTAPGSGSTNPPKPGGPTPVAPSPTPVSPSPAKPVGSTPTSSEKREHVVANGDTMSVIAEKYLGDKNQWQLIAKANPLVDPARMAIGTKLVIPAKPTASNGTAGGATKPTTPAGGANTHTIASGDTLISLARKFYGKDTLWELIYDANKKVIGDDPANLKVGMVLTIPAKPASAEPAKAPTKPTSGS